MKLRRRLASITAATGVLTLFAPYAANASVVSVGVGGDTDWGIKATVSTSTYYPRLNTTMTGNVRTDYSAHFLGLPIPVTGYVVSSFPYMPFARPTDLSDNLAGTLSFGYSWDGYMGKYAWTATGKSSFWGSNSLYINGVATADTARQTGYYHGGTGTGHDIDANAKNYVKVS